MASKTDFSTEEWALLARAPFMTGLIVSLSSPSGITGVLSESMVVTRAVLEAANTQTTSTLVKAIANDIKDTRGKVASAQGTVNIQNAKEVARDTLKQAAALVSQKASPEEVAAYKDWLKGIAKHSAEAATEGGLFGLGGVQVSDAEKSALSEIDSLLA